MSFPRYESYKDSGIEWLGEVPGHWNVKRLRFVAQLNPSKGETAELDRRTEISFLPMEAIGDDGSLNLDRTRLIGEVEMGYTYFREGDVTIAKITPCFENGKGTVMRGLLGGIGFGTTELIVVRPILSETSSSYLHWLFISTPFRKRGEASMYGTGGQKRVPDDFVRDFTIGFPPIQEQQTIAAFLDRETAKIDTLIAEHEQLIELLKEKRQAVISHAVTKGLNPDVPMKDSGIEWLGEVPEHWEVKRLGGLSRLIQTGPFGSQLHSEDYVKDKTPVINPSNIQNGQIIPDWSCTVGREIVERLIQHKLQNGDIVFGRRGEMGRCARVTDREVGWLCGTGSLNVRLNKDMAPEFISIYLRIDPIRKLLILESVGSTMDNLNTRIISRIPVPVPPIEEQKTISTFLDRENAKLDTLTSEAQTAIALLQERRTALISAAVTGKIDVRGLVATQSETEAAE